MKMRTNYRLSFRNAFYLLVIFFSMNACSKDDENDELTKGNIDVAVGVYKGTLKAFGSLSKDFYDAELIVTKVDDRHVKVAAKAGQPYSGVTEKTIQVKFDEYSGDVEEVLGDLSGEFWYKVESNTVRISTKKQAEDDIFYSFEGAKQ